MNDDYFETGMVGPGAEVFDDGSIASVGKMSGITVWENNYVVGIEVFYNGVSNGPKLGTDAGPNPKCTHIDFEENEYIRKLKGRSGAWLDQLHVFTTHSKEYYFGTSEGGNHFNLKKKHHIVNYLKYAVGGHLDLIGAQFMKQHEGHGHHKKKKHKEHNSEEEEMPAPVYVPPPPPPQQQPVVYETREEIHEEIQYGTQKETKTEVIYETRTEQRQNYQPAPVYVPPPPPPPPPPQQQPMVYETREEIHEEVQYGNTKEKRKEVIYETTTEQRQTSHQPIAPPPVIAPLPAPSPPQPQPSHHNHHNQGAITTTTTTVVVNEVIEGKSDFAPKKLPGCQCKSMPHEVIKTRCIYCCISPLCAVALCNEPVQECEECKAVYPEALYIPI